MNYLKTFAAIIAVLEDTPPNCVVVKIETQCLEVLSHLSHKSGVSNIDLIFKTLLKNGFFSYFRFQSAILKKSPKKVKKVQNFSRRPK